MDNSVYRNEEIKRCIQKNLILLQNYSILKEEHKGILIQDLTNISESFRKEDEKKDKFCCLFRKYCPHYLYERWIKDYLEREHSFYVMFALFFLGSLNLIYLKNKKKIISLFISVYFDTIVASLIKLLCANSNTLIQLTTLNNSNCSDIFIKLFSS